MESSRPARASSPRPLAWGAALALVAGSWTARADDDVEIRFYGDTGYSVYSATSASHVNRPALFPAVSNSFSASRIELLPTASFDRLSFLSEIMFESDPASNQFSLDVERIQAMYLVSDALRLRAGRVHTAFGYYNDAYHHARIFDLATARPYVTGFEDSGGIVPAHILGVGIDGTMPVGRAGDFTYSVDVGNARLADITSVAVSLAAQAEKAANVRLRFRPRFLTGLIFGVNAMYDDVPASVATAGGTALGSPDHLQEIDLGAHVAYVESRVHLIFEAVYVRHRDLRRERFFHNYGGFLEVGYAFGDFTPYARYEVFQFDRAGDPLFESSNFLLASTGALRDARLGVKWFPNEHIALKLEGRALHTDLGPAQLTGALQCAFGF